MHFHAHLDIFVDGKAVPVPADLGLSSTEVSELHTHDTSGVLHIEAPSTGRWALGQLFDEWNVRLDADHLGGLNASGGQTLRAFVDGKARPSNPAAIELTPHEEIALVFGTPTSTLKVPSSYAFPKGE